MSDGTVLSDLTDAVAIPDNGTLSRVLYADEHIRLVVFGFDRGQELTDHTAGVPVTIHVVRGLIELTMGDQTHEVGPTSWAQIPAGLAHAVKAVEPSVMVLTLLRSA
ncbi:MAG: cupin domain-containing protein [Acidimicrobiia bacterium]|nr:cupin domain-containing protein [Acidimicrobiia bacterium]